MIVRIKIIDATEIEAGAVFAADHAGRLMEYLSAERQFVCDLTLEQPAKEQIILIAQPLGLIDPIAAAAIGCPIAEAFCTQSGRNTRR